MIFIFGLLKSGNIAICTNFSTATKAVVSVLYSLFKVRLVQIWCIMDLMAHMLAQICTRFAIAASTAGSWFLWSGAMTSGARLAQGLCRSFILLGFGFWGLVVVGLGW